MKRTVTRSLGEEVLSYPPSFDSLIAPAVPCSKPIEPWSQFVSIFVIILCYPAFYFFNGREQILDAPRQITIVWKPCYVRWIEGSSYDFLTFSILLLSCCLKSMKSTIRSVALQPCFRTSTPALNSTCIGLDELA